MTNQTDPKTRVDLLVEPEWLIQVEPSVAALSGQAVAVHDGAIVAVLPATDAQARYDADEHVRLAGHALMPGLVNAHNHNPMTLLRGLADDTPLMVWLNQHIWPTEARVIGPEFVRDGVELAIAEMLRGGTTCCNENYFFPDVMAATYRRHGFRALVGLPVIDFPTAWAATADEYFDKGLALHDAHRGDALVSTCFAPHAPYTVCDASLERIRVLSDQLCVPVHMHVHETAQEVEESRQKYGQRPLARLDGLGLVNEWLLAVHMTQLTQAEMERCAQAGVTVVHCPESNLKLASGFCPTHGLHQCGVRLALGTDGPASNNDLDMFGEMRTAALLAKAVSGDAAALPAAQVLRMATIEGARALRMDDRIGSIEAGKRADLVAVDLSSLETQPVYDPVSQLVYAAGRHQVREVWLDGRRRLRHGELVDMDVPGILARAHAWRERISAGS
ncbi:TRZ/ATZ family hydrolase [Pseudofulvimonas gallinarii]|uniref:5-methylthioadenosine/S-adenosylhomocysteine deaminase n=1 Tax=Pseudofulvimonas gallinarii TaxID=634155 RepID=A0A4S3KZM8_9GAMM|nr:TRZ/ATZ family hydrolase [Pseudofulvimonas gallinarii]TCS99621.1 5-methylthioadenosine/S-adenosylhomocysteine deaminase [Pseudofulvimonas gallinarii]THD14810.1 N-ethylammeline chlorohydrolase [Pseudofulvimonas gallinarii]